MTSKDGSGEAGGQNATGGDPQSKDQNPFDNRKSVKKIIRIITVVAYLVSVSFVAIVLSAYYVFLWQPPSPSLLRHTVPEPQLDYLIDNSSAQLNDSRTVEIVHRVNQFRDKIFQRVGRTRQPTSAGKSKSRNSTTAGGGGRWENPETSTGVYDSPGDRKLTASFNATTAEISTKSAERMSQVSELSTALPPSSSAVEKYLENFQKNFTPTGASGETVEDVDGIVSTVDYGQTPDDSGQNVSAEISTTEVFHQSAASANFQVVQEKTTGKPNSTDLLEKLKSIYPPVYDEDENEEGGVDLEDSLETLPTSSPTSSEEAAGNSEETIEGPVDIEFDADNLPRR